MSLGGFLSIPESALLLIAAACTLFLTLRLVPKVEGPGRGDLLAFLWCAFCWCICSTLENLPLSTDARRIAGCLAWFFIARLPLLICFLLWSSTYGDTRPVAPLLRRAALAFSAIVCLVALVNPGTIMYAQIISLPSAPLRYVHGPFFYLVALFCYLTLLLTIAMSSWAQRRCPPRRRRIHAGLILSISLPLAANIGYASGQLLVFGYDPTPYTFLFTAPVLASLLAWLDLCHPLPIAYRKLFDVLTDSMIILDHNGMIVELNRPARLLPEMPHAPVGASLHTLDGWQQACADALRRPRQIIDVAFSTPAPSYWELSATALTDEGTLAGHLLLIRDISARHTSEQQLHLALAALQTKLVENRTLQDELHEQARRDPLTGCYNRRALDEMLAPMLERAQHDRQPLAVAMIDLDYFKQINDLYGHTFGDSVLKAFTMRLGELSERGEILVRMGGEEFLVILPGATLEQAQSTLEHWLTSCCSGVLVEDMELAISFSAGINALPTPEGNPNKLVQHADHAAYLAKRMGRRRVVVCGAEQALTQS